MVARLGDDSFGHDFLQALKNYNVNTEFVHLTEGISTGMAQITVAENGENTIVIVVGANNELSATDVHQASHVIKAAKVVVFQFEILVSTTIEALKTVKQGKGISIVNAAPAMANPDPRIFELSDIFCVNEPEAEILTGLPVRTVEDAKLALSKLLDRGCKVVIITLGASGSVFASHEDRTPIHVPTQHVKPIDTTGAGDMFIGGLAYYLAYHSDLPMEEIVRRSCELATMSVLKVGTQTSFPTRDELPAELFA
ncbi:ribokinase isoform X2 [Periplaneta americana]